MSSTSVHHGTEFVKERAGKKTLSSDERASVSQIINQYNGALVRYLRRRLRNAEDVADVAQEVYYRIARYKDTSSLEYPQAFLFRTAENILKDRARHNHTHRVTDHVPVDDVQIASTAPSQEKALSDKQELALLRAAILDLPPRCRQVFLLNRFENMTYPQIAAHCGISVSMVEKHIIKALAHCRNKLRDERD